MKRKTKTKRKSKVERWWGVEYRGTTTATAGSEWSRADARHLAAVRNDGRPGKPWRVVRVEVRR